MSSMSTSQGQHFAVILPSKGSPPEVVERPTKAPGPDEILVEVKSIALNPVDNYQRDMGFFIDTYPTIIGSDIAGVVVSAGSSVSNSLKVGTRVAGFASCFFEGYDKPEYGAFQKRVIIPATNVTTLPDSISFNQGSLLPMAVETAWAGWYSIGVPRDTAYTPADKQGVLVWGGASSVGSAALQTAKLIGFTVYTTASPKHHEYLKSLGATRAFDYKEKNVEEVIIKAAKEDRLTFQIAYDAVGQLQSCMDIVKELKGERLGKVASAPRMADAKADGVEATFVFPPEDKESRSEHMKFIFNIWLEEKLKPGEFVPSPAIKVVGKGFESLNKGMDELKAGVSGVKLVIEV
jgi:NADPH:quinone reductase-like Zn-dependent oxidoreductase